MIEGAVAALIMRYINKVGWRATIPCRASPWTLTHMSPSPDMPPSPRTQPWTLTRMAPHPETLTHTQRCAPPTLQALVSKLRGSGTAGAIVPSSLAGPTPGAGPGVSVGVGMGVGGGALVVLGSGATPKDKAGSEAGVVKSVLATLGQLASVARTGFKPHVAEVMPLVSGWTG